MHDRPRPHGAFSSAHSRSASLTQASLRPGPRLRGAVVVPQVSAAAWRGVCPGPCWLQRARVGPAARISMGGGEGAAESALACTMGLSTRPGLWRGVQWWLVTTVGAADRARSPQRQAHPGRPCGAGGRCQAQGSSTPPSRPRRRGRRHLPRPTGRGGRVGRTWLAAIGHREARAPASVPSNPTRVCRRRRTASARASLPLFAAPET